MTNNRPVIRRPHTFHAMNQAIRKAALARYLEQTLNGNRGALIRNSGLTKGRVSQMLISGFGDRAARDIEQRLQLPMGYFDQAELAAVPTTPTSDMPTATPIDLAAALQRDVADLVNAWLALPEFERVRTKQDIERTALRYRAPPQARGPQRADVASA